MADTVTATIILPLPSAKRWEPEYIATLEHEARLALSNKRIVQKREKIVLPSVGDVVVLFDQVPAHGYLTDFTLSLLPIFDTEQPPSARGLPVVEHEDTLLFFRVKRLPHVHWDDYWQRIYIDEDIKHRALNYCLLAFTLAQRKVSRMALAQHRILIFYGPPGTGKTSLVRGLANHVAGQLKQKSATNTIYMEINAHTLANVGLGDTPKNIAKAFQYVGEIASSGSVVIFVLDEVESLLTNRIMTLNDANPVDVYRAVNAVLEQIDRLAEHPNVYIFATSNLPKAIDKAFFDRADMVFYVDVPNEQMRHMILSDALTELNTALGAHLSIPSQLSKAQEDEVWRMLLAATEGLSGRQLRKMITVAMSADCTIAAAPQTLTVQHIMLAAQGYKERFARDQQHGGVYE